MTDFTNLNRLPNHLLTLIANNNYLKTLIDPLPSALFLVDKDFKICDANPEAKEMFKIDAEEIVHRLCG